VAERSHAGRQDRHDERDGRRPRARDAAPRSTDPGLDVDPRLVAQLPGAQLQRMAEAIQGSVGNHEAATLLGTVQREPTGAPDQKQVSILRARVVQKPSFIARTVATLSRGDTVTLTGERQGDWFHVVTSDDLTGWMHRSAWASAPAPKLTSAPGVGWGPPPEEIEIGGRG